MIVRAIARLSVVVGVCVLLFGSIWVASSQQRRPQRRAPAG